MHQLSIKHSHLVVLFCIEDKDEVENKAIEELFSSIDKYKIKLVTLNLNNLIYNSIIVGTILGICEALINVKVIVRIVQSQKITNKQYINVIKKLKILGVKIEEDE